MSVEWTGFDLHIRYVLESQVKLEMIEFSVKLMLVGLTYAVFGKSISDIQR